MGGVSVVVGRASVLELGNWRVFGPVLAFWMWVVVRSLLLCVNDQCSISTLTRLTILACLFFWVFLLIANEEPDLFWVVIPVVILQAAVAIAQFILQRDVGLSWLGELPLDPDVSGVIVVLNQGERWLRGYGLTNQPNSLAILLVICMLMLPVVTQKRSGHRRALTLVAIGFGLGGMLVTMSRWGWMCLLAGVGMNLVPYVKRLIVGGHLRIKVRTSSLILIFVLLLASITFLLLYGNAVYGRFFDLGNPLEAGSRLVRLRDMGVSFQIIATSPLIGTGPANYQQAATQVLFGAGLVPSVFLSLTAELGVVGLLPWLALLILPICRKEALGCYAPVTALWVTIFLFGIFYLNPNPTYEIRSTLLIAMAAGLVALSWQPGPPGVV
ncbi:MAG: O-antigen ligase family protein [Chloroflexota bacterium]